MRRYRKMLQVCQELAKEAEKFEQKWAFGAVVAKGNKIVGKGQNKSYKTHTQPYLYAIHNNIHKDCGFTVNSVHAEFCAISNVRSNVKLSDCILYVARSDTKPSEPCPHCWSVIRSKGIKAVVFYGKNGITIRKVR